MASKKETSWSTSPNGPKQSGKSTTKTSTSKIMEDNSVNTTQEENSNASGLLSKEKKIEKGKNTEEKTFKSRTTLEKELTGKSQQLELLHQQVQELQENLRRKKDDEVVESSNKKLYEQTKAELTKSQQELKDYADLKKKNSSLSEENYNLRERLVKQDEEIEQLKETIEESSSSKNVSAEKDVPMHKILRKENFELHYEKEQLKVERDRLRNALKEKQEQAGKMSSSLGDLEDQLLKAKRALDDRVKTSSRLEDRLIKMDAEVNRYRERFGKLEQQNKRLSDKVKSIQENNRCDDDTDRKTLVKGKECDTQKQVALLLKKEGNLLEDCRQLEKQVNQLSTKIKELEGQLNNCRPQKCVTYERGSQTDLGPATSSARTPRQDARRSTSGEQKSAANEVRKCRGIVKSLGKFFEELIQNHNKDGSNAGSRGRRTAIAARRANELLHELSLSMERVVNPQEGRHSEGAGNVSGFTKRDGQYSGQGRRNEAKSERTLWDKLSREVAHHEFTFDQLSPKNNKQNAVNDKDKEVERAEKALQKLYHQSGSSGVAGKPVGHEFTQEDASKLMDASRKQTETVVRELLHKHHGEIRALVENACQSSPVAAAAVQLRDPNAEGCGQNEASLAVQELDNFKTRTAKVQSLILKLQAVVESAKNDKDNVHCQLQAVEDELRQKEALLQAKSLELRRRHCKALETEKSLQAQIESLTAERERAGNENSRLHEVCREKDIQILEKVREVQRLHKEIAEREKAHEYNLDKMRKKVEEAWRRYESLKSRAEKRTADFNDAAEKLKVSQGYLLDLWQTLKTVDNVVDTNENEEL